MTETARPGRDTLPSKKKELRADAEAKRRAQAHEQEQRLRRAFAVTFGNADGHIVLEWIRKQCLHNETPLGHAAGSLRIDPEITVYRAAQQDLYLKMRRMIPKQTLMEVEYD